MKCTKSCALLEEFPELPLGFSNVNFVLDPSLDQGAVAIMKSLLLAKEEAKNLEQDTRAQSASTLWGKEWRNRLTSSNFGRILSRKTKKSNLVKELLKNDKIYAPSLKHGQKYEAVAALKYSKYMCDC